MPADVATRNVVASLLPDALIGLAVVRLPQRLPWSDEDWMRLVLVHSGLLLLFIAASGIGWIALVRLDEILFGHLYDVSLRRLPLRIANDVLVYGTCTGLAYAWQNAASARNLAAQVAQAETLRARAHLEAMRSQLNPHFLLNTLHALIGLVGRAPGVAEDALERLGDLLRYSLRIQRDGVDEVPLRDEWSFVQSFVEIERLRLGERLMTRFDVPEASRDCIVPTFALQTLVENAIRHAIAPRAEGGTIDVTVLQIDERLRIEVTDEGLGSMASQNSEHFGVGLRLLRERLAALHGGDASLEMQAAAGGMRAVLDLPLRRVGDRS